MKVCPVYSLLLLFTNIFQKKKNHRKLTNFKIWQVYRHLYQGDWPNNFSFSFSQDDIKQIKKDILKRIIEGMNQQKRDFKYVSERQKVHIGCTLIKKGRESDRGGL